MARRFKYFRISKLTRLFKRKEKKKNIDDSLQSENSPKISKDIQLNENGVSFISESEIDISKAILSKESMASDDNNIFEDTNNLQEKYTETKSTNTDDLEVASGSNHGDAAISTDDNQIDVNNNDVNFDGMIDATVLEGISNEDEIKNSRKLSIHFAAQTGSLELMQVLLQLGQNINMKDSKGQTALQIACQFGQNEIVKFLLENGAFLTDNKSSDSNNATTNNNRERSSIFLLPINIVERSVESIRFWFQIKRNDSETEPDESASSGASEHIKHCSSAPSLTYIRPNETNIKPEEGYEIASEANPNESFIRTEFDSNISAESLSGSQSSMIPNQSSINELNMAQELDDQATEIKERSKRQVQFSRKLSIMDEGEIRIVMLNDAEKKKNLVRKRKKSRKHKLKY